MSAGDAAGETRQSISDLDRLTPLSWTGSMAVILGGLIASFFLFGFWNPYWRIADQDILLIYDALLQNSGIPREIVLHPAHLSVLTLSTAFRLLHSIGWLDVYSLATLPSASDLDAFNRSWTAMVRIGRVMSLAIVLAYVSAFGLLLRCFLQNWRVAALGMFAIAYSGGIAMSARSIKPELLSGSLVAIALLVLLIAARSPRMVLRPLLVGAGAFLATLAMVNKVQAIFLIMALPVLLLPFGEPSGPGGYWTRRRAYWSLAMLSAVAIIAAAFAAPLFVEGLFPGTELYRHPIFGAAGAFQALLAIWISLGMLAFALLWRVPPREAAAAAIAVIGGVALGLTPLYVFHEPAAVAIVINPIESLFVWVSGHGAECRSGECGLPFALLFRSLWQMVLHHTFFLHTSPRPEIFLEWLVVGLIVLAFRRGERKVALQAALLMATLWGIDTLQAARALKQDYFHFTDPLIIIAAALLLANEAVLARRRWIYPVGVALIGLHIVFSQAEPIKHALLLRSGPEKNCEFLNNLRHIERFPFCRS